MVTNCHGKRVPYGNFIIMSMARSVIRFPKLYDSCLLSPVFVCFQVNFFLCVVVRVFARWYEEKEKIPNDRNYIYIYSYTYVNKQCPLASMQGKLQCLECKVKTHSVSMASGGASVDSSFICCLAFSSVVTVIWTMLLQDKTFRDNLDAFTITHPAVSKHWCQRGKPPTVPHHFLSIIWLPDGRDIALFTPVLTPA